MVRNLDDLNEFDDYVNSVLPRIRKMRRAGKTGKEIYEAFKDDLIARKMTIAMDTSIAPEKALAAMNSLEDRIEGKPVERRVSAHAYAEMPDKSLDALLLSELESESPPEEEGGEDGEND